MKYKNIDIVYEDNHVIVVSKPAGMLSQKDITDDDSILEEIKEYLKIKYNKPGNVFLGSVHRIDRPASGLLVLAKTSKALSRLTESIRKMEFSKKYYAIIEGKVDQASGTLEHYLLKDPNNNTVKVSSRKIDNSKLSRLNYKRITEIKNRTLLEIDLLTGRPHQIRAQLSFTFGPILGDVKYGSHYMSDNHKIYLHCFHLAFPHPTTKDIMTFHFDPDVNDSEWELFRKYIL